MKNTKENPKTLAQAVADQLDKYAAQTFQIRDGTQQRIGWQRTGTHSGGGKRR